MAKCFNGLMGILAPYPRTLSVLSLLNSSSYLCVYFFVILVYNLSSGATSSPFDHLYIQVIHPRLQNMTQRKIETVLFFFHVNIT